MSGANEPVVELQGVTVEFPGGVRAVEDVDLRVFEHDLLGLLGPNGAGKSTLIDVILGLRQPTRGTVRLFGAPLSPEGLARVGFVPQKPQATYPDFPATVLETVLLGFASRARFFQGLGRRERERAKEVLEMLAIGDLEGRRIGRLSGGQTQRVFVAKAIVAEPRLLILDEPTSGMDVRSRRDFYAMLQGLNRDIRITTIITSHDVHNVTKLANRIAFISGRVFFDGGPGEFAAHPIHSDLEDFPEAVMAKA
jgi:zinc transport system ATP-binding protein